MAGDREVCGRAREGRRATCVTRRGWRREGVWRGEVGMCHGLSCGMEHKRLRIQTVGVGKWLCAGSHGSYRMDICPACQLRIWDPWMVGSLAGNSTLGKSTAVGVKVVTQALNEAVSLGRLYTFDEAGQAGDTLLKTSFVDRIGGHLHLGSPREQSRSVSIMWV